MPSSPRAAARPAVVAALLGSVALASVTLAGPAGADTWTPPSSLDPDGSTVSVAATDRLDVAGWSSVRSSSPKAYVAVRTDGGWSSPEPLGGGGYQSRPVFATAPDGTVTAVWTESRPRRPEARVLSSTYADGAWSVPTQIWQGRDAMFPSLGANAAGDMVLAWTAARPHRSSGAGTASYAVRAMLRPAGGAWGPVTRIDDRRDALRAAFAVGIDDEGRALVSWAEVDPGPDGLWVRRYDGSAWTTPTRVAALGYHAFDVQLAADGRAAAVYVAAGTPRGDRARVRLMRSDGTWGPAVALDQRDGVVRNGDASLTMTEDGWLAAYAAGPRGLWARAWTGGRWQPSALLHPTRATASDVQLLVRPDADDVLLWTEPTDDGAQLRSATRAGDGWTPVEALGDAATGTLERSQAASRLVVAWLADAGTTVATADPSPPPT